MLRKMLAWGTVLVLVSFVGLSSNGKAEEEKGLAARWNFDEGTGEVAKDSSGNKNDGKIYGATYVKRGDGYVLEFDGKDDYVDCGNGKSLNFGTGDFSIEMWIKTPAPNIEGKIISKYFDGDNRWYIMTQRDNLLYSFGKVGGDGFMGIQGATDMSDGYWHHVVAVIHKGTTSHIYVDAVVDGSGAAKEGDWDNTANLYIGRYGTTTGLLYYFKGLIDEIAIYNRALTDEEIKEHYETWWSNASE